MGLEGNSDTTQSAPAAFCAPVEGRRRRRWRAVTTAPNASPSPLASSSLRTESCAQQDSSLRLFYVESALQADLQQGHWLAIHWKSWHLSDCLLVYEIVAILRRGNELSEEMSFHNYRSGPINAKQIPTRRRRLIRTFADTTFLISVSSTLTPIQLNSFVRSDIYKDFINRTC